MVSDKDLHIEKITGKDFPLHFLLVSNARVMEMITGKPMNEEEAKAKFTSILKCNNVNPKLGYFKITETQTGSFIGVAKLEIKEKESTEAEIGYLILPEFWGKGIVSKIAKRLLEIAKTNQKLRKVFAIIDPENIASRRILEKNGFESKEFKDFDGLPGEVLELIVCS